ncbi:TPA: hypothetical protein LSH94_003064 [Morganella morganii]|uniref:hypothetical protein n=1 Tax=Morganella morganii TaxID=582 RepID=UPI0013C31CA3|nr:hypothetical protein [Morganella morganii]HBL6966821.1 hypothetical protein [Morganella morganii]
MNEFIQIVTTAIVSLGGGAAIIVGFVKWFGDKWIQNLFQNKKHELDQMLENYKIKLKKSEFIFQKEFEAASEIVALIRSLLPTYNYPDMDWHDACDEIAQNFSQIEINLKRYLAKNGAILQKIDIDLIECCIGMAGESKFEINSPEVPDSANKAANELYEKLKEVEKNLLHQIHSQSDH